MLRNPSAVFPSLSPLSSSPCASSPTRHTPLLSHASHARGRAEPVASPPSISIVLAVRDDEDVVGHHVRRLAGHFTSLGVPFEIVAVNDGSVDNSFQLLELLAQRTPTLRIVRLDSSGRAYLRGASEARGGIVVLLAAGRPLSLAPLAWALSRLASGRDAVVLRGRYVVARRLRVMPVVARVPGPGPAFERAFERRAADLQIDVVGSRPARQAPVHRLLAPVLRFLTV